MDVKGVERCLHAILKDRQYRKRKEFYKIELDDLKQIIDNCGNSIKLLKKNNNKTTRRKTMKKNDKQNNYYVSIYKQS